MGSVLRLFFLCSIFFLSNRIHISATLTSTTWCLLAFSFFKYDIIVLFSYRHEQNYLGVERGHLPTPPPPHPSILKKFPNIYIYIYIHIKNILLSLKLIYLPPLSQKIYKLTHETKKEKKLSNHLLSSCPKNIKKNI